MAHSVAPVNFHSSPYSAFQSTLNSPIVSYRIVPLNIAHDKINQNQNSHYLQFIKP